MFIAQTNYNRRVPGWRRFPLKVLPFRAGPKVNHGCAPASGFGGSIRELEHVGRTRQDAAHGLALYSNPAPMNNAQRAQPQAARFGEILFDHGFDIARRNGVEVEDISNGNADRLGRFFHEG
jgi:hypothetical protein